MKRISASFHISLFVILFILSLPAYAQDKIYFADGTVVLAKVAEVTPVFIKYSRTEIQSGPVYTVKLRDVDSIVYEKGIVDNIITISHRRVLRDNIPQLNTWNYNLFGFAHLTISQSYERRVVNGKIGLRVPLYIGFYQNLIAGMGTFTPLYGVTDYKTEVSGLNGRSYFHNGVSFATGLNPRFYLFKHRIARVFAGPEADLGFSAYRYVSSYKGYAYSNRYDPYFDSKKTYVLGTFAALGIVGLSLNPRDKFNMTFHGGAGVGSTFSKSTKTSWTGVWQIGFSLGTNF